MPDLILNEDQAKQIVGALVPIPVRNPQGQLLGHLEPKLTPEIIAELKRRAAAPGPRYSGAQIQARLQALQEEWDRVGSFDEAYMEEFLKRFDETDPPHFRHPRPSE